MASVGRTARSIGLVVGLTIAVLVATGALLTYARYSSANKQQRLVVNNYETISLMRQALIVLQDTEIGQHDRIHRAGAAAAQALEADARVGQQGIEHAPRESAVRAAALQREVEATCRRRSTGTISTLWRRAGFQSGRRCCHLRLAADEAEPAQPAAEAASRNVGRPLSRRGEALLVADVIASGSVVICGAVRHR